MRMKESFLEEIFELKDVQKLAVDTERIKFIKSHVEDFLHFTP